MIVLRVLSWLRERPCASECLRGMGITSASFSQMIQKILNS